MINRPKHIVRGVLLLAPTFGLSMPALAQKTQPGRNAAVADTDVGERQTREEAAPNIEPTRRISSRVQNRIQSRLRNRIDRNYKPMANAASPFEVAEEQADAAGRRTQRR